MTGASTSRLPLPDTLAALPVLAILRGLEPRSVLSIAHALVEAGVRTLEVTLNSPRALESIQRLRGELGCECTVGAGTVRDAIGARSAIDAGAQLLVTPHVAHDVVGIGGEYGVPALVGAFTPSEVLAAWSSGAAAVKVFPAARLGSRYLADLLGPFDDVSLVSVGGIGIVDVVEHLEAGAVAVGLGSSLVGRDPEQTRQNVTRLSTELALWRNRQVNA